MYDVREAMLAILIVYLLIGVNKIIGAFVWAAIDYKDRRLYKWYDSCPDDISWFAQPLVLNLWIVGLYIFIKERRWRKNREL